MFHSRNGVARWLRRAMLLVAVAAVGLLQPSYTAAFPTTDDVVISNLGAILAGSVATFPAGAKATGKRSRPATYIFGPSTGLDGNTGAAVSPANLHTYVANQLGPGAAEGFIFGLITEGNVLGFAPGSTGDSAPEIVIQGLFTGLSWPAGVAFDSYGNLYVANELNGLAGSGAVISGSDFAFTGPACVAFGGFTLGTITIYDDDANGNTFPSFADVVVVFDPVLAAVGGGLRLQFSSIGGCSSFMLGPVGIAVDSDDRIWVVNQFGGYINVYDPDVTGLGDVVPVGAFIGSGFLSSARYIALGDGPSLPELYVTDAATNSINFFDTFFTGGGPPFAISAGFDGSIAGKRTQLKTPQGIAANSDDDLFVANTVGNSFAEFLEGALGNVRPFSLIRGRGTKLNQPVGIALQPED